MIDKINGGYIALAVVGSIFFALQVWRTGLTISNGRNEQILIIESQSDEIKKKLEKTFLES